MENKEPLINKNYKDYYVAHIDEIDFSVKDRTLVHTITTPMENRNSRIVNPSLVDFKNYMGRPIITLDHLNSALAQIATMDWCKLKNDNLVGQARFIRTNDADVLFSIIEQTKNYATSMEYMSIDEPDIITKPNGDYAIKFGRVDLLANSFVGVPANPECVGNLDYINTYNEKVMNLDFINSLPQSIITSELHYRYINKELTDKLEMLTQNDISQKAMLDEIKGGLDVLSKEIKKPTINKDKILSDMINRIKNSQKNN